jgi:transcription elongation GreA/GreB family factor
MNSVDAQAIKQSLVKATIEKLNADLSQAITAAEEAHKGATHEQSKAETQYDTIGLEHAYLAEGQSRRIEQLKLDIMALENWSIPEFDEDSEIYQGALVQLSNLTTKKIMTVFLVPAGGGHEVLLSTPSKLAVNIITPTSPIGDALLGIGLEDIAETESGQHFEVMKLW